MPARWDLGDTWGSAKGTPFCSDSFSSWLEGLVSGLGEADSLRVHVGGSYLRPVGRIPWGAHWIGVYSSLTCGGRRRGHCPRWSGQTGLSSPARSQVLDDGAGSELALRQAALTHHSGFGRRTGGTGGVGRDREVTQWSCSLKVSLKRQCDALSGE